MEAIESYRKVLALDPNSVHAHSNLGNALRTQGKLEEAAWSCERALAIVPDFMDALNNLAGIRVEQGMFADALALYEKALAGDPRDAELRLSYGMLRLALWDFEQGWLYYQSRPARALEILGSPDDAPPRDVTGKTALLLGEQGIGDELFFLRFAARLKEQGARLLCRCDRKIRCMLERTGLFDRIVAHGEPLPSSDLTILVGDLPLVSSGASRAVRADISARRLEPPLRFTVLDARLDAMRRQLARLGSPPYTGVTWRAGTPLAQQRTRRIRALRKEVPLETLATALKEVPGTVLALQRHPNAGEIDALGGLLGRAAHDLSGANDDLEDMLALLALIDEYIGVSNTNMHLMAGLGKTARVLVPNPAEWRWMAEGRESPWFPGFSVYRQLPDRDWSPACERLAEDLHRSLIPGAST